MNKVVASIITYNPDMDRLEKNIKAIATQVDCVVIVDNNSNNKESIQKLLENVCTVSNLKYNFLANDDNVGIAKALNQAVDYSKENMYPWILTLDQDSVCDKHMIENMFEKYSVIEDSSIALIAPEIVDENETIEIKEISDDIEYPISVITSGSLMKTDIACQIGRFTEELFIDHVDFDLCLRLFNSGFKILKVNSAIIYHQLGEISEHKILGKDMNTTNHSPLRRYYYYRNLVYMYKKYKSTNSDWVKTEVSFATKNIFKIMLLEKEKFKQLKFISKGLLDGNKGVYGKYQNK